ncbi:MAG: sigma-70 family RNA polymerase sigma factor [Candidatus Aminicenantes bacterium]|nr:sigma-70 family RNA polymerase sigma factor [Candidatus Aminicenantes bacterium]
MIEKTIRVIGEGNRTEAMEPDEQTLIDGLHNGEEAAFRELVEKYKKKIYYLAYDFTRNHHDAEDISQVVFMKVYRSMRTFKRNARLSSWLHRIAVNASIDHIRKKSEASDSMDEENFKELPAEYSLGGERYEENPEKSAEVRMIEARIEKALEKISNRERIVFYLRHYNNLNLQDIAETLGLSLGAVKSFLFRAVRKLRKELSAYQNPDSLEASNEYVQKIP